MKQQTGKLKDGERNTTKTIYIDADDFSEENQGWDYLAQIKKEIPNFKISLFTILGQCSNEFIEEIKGYDWIDMIPHGWMHETPLECKDWSYKQSIDYLKKIERHNLTKGFKAPGWQISDGMYQALLEEEYWVADQPYNSERVPKGLKVYLLDSQDKYHYHIQNVCGNGLQESLYKILSLKGDFKLIKEVI